MSQDALPALPGVRSRGCTKHDLGLQLLLSRQSCGLIGVLGVASCVGMKSLRLEIWNYYRMALIDGLYVVKTDWFMPSASDPSFTAIQSDPVAHQNNAVVASMMVPGTQFGAMHPSLYRNIFVEDAPQVLFSLKIIPPRPSVNTDAVPLTDSSMLNLNIENLFAPPSTVASSIGFQILPGGYTFGVPVQTFPTNYTLTGSMKINLTNVILKMPDGNLTPLTAANAGLAGFGDIQTNPNNLDIHYDFAPGDLLWSLLSLLR